MNSKALVAEFVGTFTLIFIGAGAAAISGSLVAVALAHGLVVLGFAYAYGPISGTHINPAVTIGLLVGGQIDFAKAAGYIVVQLIGGVAGAAALNFVLGAQAGTLGATVPAEGVGVAQTFVLEMLLTFFLVNAIYFTAVSGKAGDFAPIAIGLGLTLIHLISIPVTNTSVNPARSTGPAIFVGGWALQQLWLFWVAPIIGAAIAGVVYRWLGSSED